MSSSYPAKRISSRHYKPKHKDSEDIPKEVSSTNRIRCSGKTPRDSKGN